ncbi:MULTISPECIES: hypothetical protein [Bacteroides]|nr:MULTISPECIES: hypothetical protein [Bacteroides]MBC5588833.1 hypothetical protein [Bacteroides sp. NSJ-39]
MVTVPHNQPITQLSPITVKPNAYHRKAKCLPVQSKEFQAAEQKVSSA